MLRIAGLIGLLLIGSCGGGGGGAAVVAFAVAGTVPRAGETAASPDADLTVTLTLPADLSTVVPASLFVETAAGVRVSGAIVVNPVTAAILRFSPLFRLEENAAYRLVVRASIRAGDGTPLPGDTVVPFITSSPTPTVRPDQVADLGEVLRVPRHLGRAARLPTGGTLVCGGYAAVDTVTDTAEIYEPGTGLFRLLPVRMTTPRVEHSLCPLPDGRILVTGGIAEPRGDPLASSEIFDPASETFAPGPPLNFARRSHASSGVLVNGSRALVTGGYGEDGAARSDGELLLASAFQVAPGSLGEGIAEHLQFALGVDRVYIGVGNILAWGAYFDGTALSGRQEGDSRFRAQAVEVPGDRVLVVGGDTRSMSVFDFATRRSHLANDLLFERRGAHSLTRRGEGDRFLAAGGFNIALPGSPPLDSFEVIEYLPVGEFGFPDAVAYYVDRVRLPAPVAGHVAILTADGSTLLAGGVHAAGGAPSRRGMLVRAD